MIIKRQNYRGSKSKDSFFFVKYLVYTSEQNNFLSSSVEAKHKNVILRHCFINCSTLHLITERLRFDCN